MEKGVSVIGGEEAYDNDALKSMIESETGRQVMLMYRTDYEGSEYIISITLPDGIEQQAMSNDELMKNAEICASTFDTLCDCIKIPELGGFLPTGMIIAR